ncbi:DUF551 domain-containing protein [Escherichia coli]|uniref:DUF551 domain-containing protein n=1 Tax=Escherichia coli TaxID=562 RepID=UPI00197C469F|nr:DUF551 domain-containing protein [Escherichia coli]EFN9919935.1 DUF551 domain-containing protein [Escherichia coli]EHW2700215.1 DUF551 domain-containing protein [Escherichia coli]EHW3096959.1 DUF551 domain-containing protein [Escherichia coli]EJZ2800006.1 DUF551 domain-containing protein [Escherichia coli]
MTTFTNDDKKLIKEIRERIGSLDVRDNIERRAYEIALASLEAEPIAMVVPDEMDLLTCHLDGVTKTYADGWNACRAAMLHSAEPVSQAYKLNALDGNSPVTPDGWISCSERMPPQDDWILIYSKHGEYMAGQVQGEYVELSDGTLSWLGNALFWMQLPEPPQEVNQ